MNGNNCQLYPEVNGKPSKLYKGLLKSINNRPVVNMLYGAYISSNMAAQMDQNGYKRNAQGEHNAEDVKAVMNYSQMASEMGSISSEEIRLGAVDSNGQRINYQDAKVALEKADAFNDSHKGLVANVYQHGDNFQIVVSEKNANTLMQPVEIKERLKAWEVVKQAFNAINYDVDNVPQELKATFNPNNDFLTQYLKNLSSTRPNILRKKDVQVLFSIYENSSHVQRVINAFGSIESAAQALEDWSSGNDYLTSAQKRLLINSINFCQQFQGLNINALHNQVQQISQQIRSLSPEEAIKSTLHKLNKKYHININEYHIISDKLKSLSEVAATIVMNLERQIRELEREQGNNTEGKDLERIKQKLLTELKNKKYYYGTIQYLQKAAIPMGEIDGMIASMPQTGDPLEIAKEKATVLQNIADIKERYYHIIDALADENLIIDESIGQTEIDNIRQEAKRLKELYDKKEKVIDAFRESAMLDIVRYTVGDKAPDGQSIANVVKLFQADSGIQDFLYSIGRSSNITIATMGHIIRSAQNSRDSEMNRIALELRRATDKLYKSGSTSEFMYEDDNVHIISDIDWQSYEAARKAYAKAMVKSGLQGYELKLAIQDWEDNNTTDRIVDAKTGRTEKIPNDNFRKAFPQLSKAQKEYYDTVMQLKGEIGSLMPAFAQKQYLAPQLRRSFLDAVGHAKNGTDVAMAIWHKMENMWTIREDDTNFNPTTTIDGEEYQLASSAFDNTQLREIPIFFVNKLKDSNELLKDFSSGLQALAATAINYDAMNNIEQLIRFMGTYVKEQSSRNKEAQADLVENSMMRVVKDLTSWAKKNNNTSALIDGFIAQHLYGQKLDPNQVGYKYRKLVSMLVGYTSFKGLATNLKGAFNNYLVGEYQMFVEAGAGEFYGIKEFIKAHALLFGDSGVKGEIMELATNNINHKGVLFRELFDPVNENFSDKRYTRYYKSMFRQLLGHDCSFIGYASGEYLIHYVNMYGILLHDKVLLNGKKISLYDAFEVVNKKDGNSELKLKNGVTTLTGEQITPEWLDEVRKKIRYANQSTHGAMNDEDKGLIHQYLLGRMAMNFRQWMVEHYSRRFRARHFDDTLKDYREGYWVSTWKYFFNENTKDTWNDGNKTDAVGMFIKDMIRFVLRAESQWDTLTEDQKYNVKRAHSEIILFAALSGLAFALGEPDEHKREFWRRWWIYQTKRLLLDAKASSPHWEVLNSGLTILQTPMAGISTMNSLLYVFYGLTNGDITKELKSGPHKGENKYMRNIKKSLLPGYKDWEQMQQLSTSDAIFKPFENSPNSGGY